MSCLPLGGPLPAESPQICCVKKNTMLYIFISIFVIEEATYPQITAAGWRIFGFLLYECPYI